MTDEQLIEEAAKAIDPGAWSTGAHDPRWAGESEHRRIAARRQATDALAVFEKAHTPTDDERATVLAILSDMDYNDGGMMRWSSGRPTEQAEKVADRILRELRPIPTPTDEAREALRRDLYSLRGWTGRNVFWRIDVIDRAIEALGASVVQPEPSDAVTNEERKALARVISNSVMELYAGSRAEADREGEHVASDVLAAGFRRSVPQPNTDPTDDEREALLAVLDNRLGLCYCQSYAGERHDHNPPCSRVKLADEILALRRSVPEPSAEPKHDESCAEWCNHCQVCGCGIRFGSRCQEHYQNQPEPQAEPSDAALLDAANAYMHYEPPYDDLSAFSDQFLDDLRAALRAASVTAEPMIECPHWSPGNITLRRGCTACAAVTEQGENRG